MKNMKTKACIIYAIICAVLLAQPRSFAQSIASEAEVEFTPGTGPTYPVHPEDPNIEGNEGGVEGSLALVSVSGFDFGIIPVKSVSELFGVVTSMPNIQVVDLRGTGTGWNVSATVSRFTDGNKDTLPGAAIHIIDGRPNSTATSPAPAQKPNAILTTDGNPAPVLNAQSGAGMGLWVMRWYPQSGNAAYVKLEIPAGSAVVGSHTATINWILGDTP